ncbi:DUF1524 domain-containing protein [Agromyces sp. MMS17-SY077]|uniref:DUF1524 domain-containing protein n=1 Tax=Agromyces seonyuensis TaxID=2662446 RepID=A0A6I4P1U5_9MICO|nr:HNH endonuclease family protein [Agromyces seonyuensis]MWB98009.1 DUF1524 domain-containing protein [Agromyces seonyuensis]
MTTIALAILVLLAWYLLAEPDGSSGADPGDGPVVDAGGDGRDYERDLFGHGWLDPDGNGCDARNDVLARDLASITLDGDGCTVLTGILDDPYTGSQIAFARGVDTSAAVQIDHVVPLSYAWRHGADEWDEGLRERFANDPENLLAVDGPANNAKSDSGPGEWLPGDAYVCAYADRFEAVLVEYGLTIAPEDERALSSLAPGCR